MRVFWIASKGNSFYLFTLRLYVHETKSIEILTSWYDSIYEFSKHSSSEVQGSNPELVFETVVVSDLDQNSIIKDQKIAPLQYLCIKEGGYVC